MCLRQVFQDIHSALRNPPQSTLDREALNGRLRAYWVRCQYILWNALATALLYTFSDSLPNVYYNRKQYYYNIIFHSFQALSIITYFTTSFRNPGYIEPVKLNSHNIHTSDSIDIDLKDAINEFEQENEQDYKYLDMNMEFVITHIKTGDSAAYNDKKTMDAIHASYPYEIVRYIPDYNADIIIDPNSSPSNFCWRCKFIRPIRSKHCYDCDRCVGKFDHHCPMVGNCVAGNNHRFFVLFMLSQTVVVLWSFYVSLNTLFEMSSFVGTQTTMYIGRSVIGWLLRITVFVSLFFAVFVTVGLSGYHCYLSITNQTTYEMIKPQMVEKYIKDELKRKRKYIKRADKRRLKQLKKNKEIEIKRGKELKRQRMELQKQIEELQDVLDDHDAASKEDEKDEHKEACHMSLDEEDSEEDTMSSDDTSSSEKLLLFNEKQQRAKHNNKKGGTPKPEQGRKRRKRDNKWSNFTDEYINYFDEGLAANLWIFITGKMHPEWQTALACTVIKKRSANKSGK